MLGCPLQQVRQLREETQQVLKRGVRQAQRQEAATYYLQITPAHQQQQLKSPDHQIPDAFLGEAVPQFREGVLASEVRVSLLLRTDHQQRDIDPQLPEGSAKDAQVQDQAGLEGLTKDTFLPLTALQPVENGPVLLEVLQGVPGRHAFPGQSVRPGDRESEDPAADLQPQFR